MSETPEYTLTALPRLELAQLTARVREMSEIESEIGPMFERVGAAFGAAGIAFEAPGVAHYTVDGDEVIAAAAEQIVPERVPAGLEAAVLDQLHIG